MNSTTDAAKGDVGAPDAAPKARRKARIPAQSDRVQEPAGPQSDRPDGQPEPEEMSGLVEAAGQVETAEFVAFEMSEEMYAFPMDRVQEIIRMPEVVRVPLGPPALEGLANLRGRVLPVVSLRRCCGLPTAEHDEATRVIVVEASNVTIGFVVDRVTAVTTAEADDVESADTVQSTIRSELLAAVVKAGSGRMTTVLDVQHLIDNGFALLTTKVANTSATTARTGSDDEMGEGSVDTMELVSFSVDGQEYALPIDRVREIVQTPERITPVPNADARVVGVMDLRGGLLPVISLRQIFGLPVTELEAQNRIIVVTIRQDGKEGLAGVVLDTVREVLRVPAQLVDDLPAIVRGGARHTEVQSVCRLDSGARLVSVLSADALVDLHELDSAVRNGENEAPPTRGEETTVDVDDGRGSDELLVVFRLEDEEYCVDVDAVQEIIRVPDALVRVPRTLDFVEGLVNLRGMVLPVVDLRTRLGLKRAARDERQRIVVLIIAGIRTGFVVDSVAEVLKVSTADLEAAPELSAEQAEVVTRVANLAEHTRMLLVLDTARLLEAGEAALLVGELGSGHAA